MISYLNDIIEDATDFSWSSAKASHAVLLCEMERESLDWENTDRIDRIRRAHAQKHVSHQKTSWQKNENKQRPWFYKFYQNGTCQLSTDHKVGGKSTSMCAHIALILVNNSVIRKKIVCAKNKQVQKTSKQLLTCKVEQQYSDS